MKAGWVNGLNWLNWGEKSIMHKIVRGECGVGLDNFAVEARESLVD